LSPKASNGRATARHRDVLEVIVCVCVWRSECSKFATQRFECRYELLAENNLVSVQPRRAGTKKFFALQARRELQFAFSSGGYSDVEFTAVDVRPSRHLRDGVRMASSDGSRLSSLATTGVESNKRTGPRSWLARRRMGPMAAYGRGMCGVDSVLYSSRACRVCIVARRGR
jgi:hypothetical protein